MNAGVAFFKTTFVIAPNLDITFYSTKVKSYLSQFVHFSSQFVDVFTVTLFFRSLVVL